MVIASEVIQILDDYPGVSLQEITRASLMRRKDSKYVLMVEKLPALLEAVRDHYSVLEIEGHRAQSYDTVYFDTPGLDMYLMHHNGRVNRHKIRLRKYEASEDMFLEVKMKDAKGVTSKNRVETRECDAPILSTEEEFLAEYTPYNWEHIAPALRNQFKRITLVRHDQQERITLDFQLWFSSELSDHSMEVPGISIAEIKYQGLLAHSPFHLALRNAGVLPRRFSKYCMGMALLHPDLKQNLFKEKLRYMMKLNQQYLQHQIEIAYA